MNIHTNNHMYAGSFTTVYALAHSLMNIHMNASKRMYIGSFTTVHAHESMHITHTYT